MNTPNEEKAYWKDVKEQVKEKKEKFGLSIGSIAKELRMNPRTLQGYLSGSNTPSALAQYGLLAWVHGFRYFAPIRPKLKRKLSENGKEAAIRNLKKAEPGQPPRFQKPDINARPEEDIEKMHFLD